ncbi:nuclease-related domain-containing protein [Ammoniphilus sp. YIM 78166]|uniref:nuclease-related domain-containing protein n=1 Tax=Ammoniphilus sp. YIM 78166 TaxID=1644106 RepID=UPI0010705F47|nr:nuclease-related domain-containing protein [Ammoniphilus sp. YIM 78166]
MIIKTRETPILLQQEEALKRRLPASHPHYEDLSYSIAKGRKGHAGEKQVDYEVSFLPDRDYLMFQDLRLMVGSKRAFQIDLLILSPHLAILIETKNIYGKLFFDRFSKQVIRTYKNKQEGFPNPILQGRKHQSLFQEWLVTHQFSRMPVEHLVAIGDPATIVETNDNAIFQKVLHAAHIPDKILELHEGTAQALLNSNATEQLSKLLLDKHTVYYTDVLKKYRVDPSQLIEGVLCPNCQLPGMARGHSAWHCSGCGGRSKDAHVQAVRDYLLLFGSITNEQCRRFLKLSSPDTAKRILTSLKLPYRGLYKDRTYLLWDTPPSI